MPPKPKPKPKKAEPPLTTTDNYKCQAFDATKQPIKWPCQRTNQKNPQPEKNEDESNPAFWAISKDKMKEPAQGQGNQRQQNKHQEKS